MNPLAAGWHNTKPLAANTRLSPVVDGEVACVSLENLDDPPTTCKLPSDAVSVDTKQGSYAQAGQAIRVTTPDGTTTVFVIATKVNVEKVGEDDVRYTVPCTAPTGADTAGTASGEELAGACVVETMGTAANAAQHAHDNYATLSVCATGPNADADLPGVPKTATINCYTGEGAALNDGTGTERDHNGVYLTGNDRCHVGWNSGHEVPAAKRPATYGWPIKVNETTAVVWRAVATGLDIAN